MFKDLFTFYNRSLFCIFYEFLKLKTSTNRSRCVSSSQRELNGNTPCPQRHDEDPQSKGQLGHESYSKSLV